MESLFQYILWGVVGFFITLILILGKIYINGPKCKIAADLTDKIIFITGANSGIGEQTAIELTKRGAQLIIACRNKESGRSLIKKLQRLKSDPFLLELDLSDLASIEYCFSQLRQSSVRRIDMLINNAGLCVPNRELTAQNIEMHLGVNYIGHFHLTNLLIPYLQQAKNPRIINVSSVAHKWGVIDFKDYSNEKWKKASCCKCKYILPAYGGSKLANILHAIELSRKYNWMKAVSLHPGTVRSDFFKNQKKNVCFCIFYYLFYPIWYYFTRNCEDGAQTTLYCCLEDFDNLEPGGYYQNCKLSKASNINNQSTSSLWEATSELLNSLSID